MAHIAKQTIIERWTILDNSDNPLTGLASPADVVFYLMRQSGSALIAATETVSLVETAVAGHYYISFTPDNEGYYSLSLHEIDALTQGRWKSWSYEILQAGAEFTPSYVNAFCAQSDIERWSQLAFSATSKPTTVQVAAFAESRASEIVSFLASVGYAVLPNDAGLVGTVQEDMLREANAIGAAADSIVCKFMQESPSRTEKADALLEEYDKRVERLVEYAKQVLAVGTMGINTPMSSGELTLRTETTQEDTGLRDAIRMDQEW